MLSEYTCARRTPLMLLALFTLQTHKDCLACLARTSQRSRSCPHSLTLAISLRAPALRLLRMVKQLHFVSSQRGRVLRDSTAGFSMIKINPPHAQGQSIETNIGRHKSLLAHKENRSLGSAQRSDGAERLRRQTHHHHKRVRMRLKEQGSLAITLSGPQDAALYQEHSTSGKTYTTSKTPPDRC